MQILFFVLILFLGVTVSNAFSLEYHNDNYNFTINYPENWNYNEKLKADKIALYHVKFFDVTDQGWNAMLQVRFIDDPKFTGFQTDKQAFDYLNFYMRKDCRSHTIENDAFVCTNLAANYTKAIKQDDKKYYEILYTWTELYGERLGQNDDTSIVRMIPSEKRMWLLYTETYTKNYETHKDTFYSMMNSFIPPVSELKTETNQDVSLSDVSNSNEKKGGCLIATATYGTELAPQVQMLREIRDNTVLGTQSGTAFMSVFNSFYYSFSPTIADLERQNPVFKEMVKIAITPLLSLLSLLQYVNINSDAQMLGYGIGIILLNVGIYFVAPPVLIYSIRKKF